MRVNRDGLLAKLDQLGIQTSTVDHPPLHTVEESQHLRGDIPGAHTKNLFVKDRKDRYFLLVVEEMATVDLKTVHQLIGASGKVSFGKPEALLELLGVVPGAVCVFGAINDDNNKVTVVLDSSLMESTIINAHPLTNEATTSIGKNDLLAFLAAVDHPPLVLKITG
ncbi:prolyl-tRNA synthetase associated domain-containing protein [Tianweitania sp. BSSL-BM11]|uniref:Prolyl-tRNA synthetase associated domain-containing protein n=1 Tax=Tianweitania aestuarii TaxID=2814886 RepID=A0ABS5RZ81_9HYPH|nr:YbaK/EbsC family protein [Tianweitania aestuarii]MBS9721622.1 prolyl-tRNA synthetase associated domain-containing protein [Tianweitania aestuarii]